MKAEKFIEDQGISGGPGVSYDHSLAVEMLTDFRAIPPKGEWEEEKGTLYYIVGGMVVGEVPGRPHSSPIQLDGDIIARNDGWDGWLNVDEKKAAVVESFETWWREAST